MPSLPGTPAAPPRSRGSVSGSPDSSTRPSTITVMRSATSNTASMSCSTSRIACPGRSRFSSATMRADSSAPMPASGSSSSSTSAPVARTIAISSWRCSPWLNVAAIASARSASPASASAVRRAFTNGTVALRIGQYAPGLRIARLGRESAVLEGRELRKDVGALVAAPDAELRAPMRGQRGDVLRRAAGSGRRSPADRRRAG